MGNAAEPIIDKLGRGIRDLRISVTDRCNFRCVYCMPREAFGAGHAFLDRKQLLTFEELERVARAFAEHGMKKIRLTGGEPLVRRDLEKLVEKLSKIPLVEDISLTTNGSLLTAEKARALEAAGLKRITISLDSMDDETFKRINDVNFSVSHVLRAIEVAGSAGLAPVKVNMVVKRGENEHEILPMARRFRGSGHVLRFIEYMDVGATNGWQLADVVSAAEIAEIIDGEHPIEPVVANYRGEVARRWRYRDGAGEIGIIASVTQPFCSDCTRARISAEGKLYTCLFATAGYDIRDVLRSGAEDAELSRQIGAIWSRRDDQYSETRTRQTVALTPRVPKIEMSYIGG